MFNELKPCNCQSCHCVSTQWVCGFCGDANSTDTIICPCRQTEDDWMFKATNIPITLDRSQVDFLTYGLAQRVYSTFHE